MCVVVKVRTLFGYPQVQDAVLRVEQHKSKAGSTNLEHRSRTIYAGVPSFFGLGFEEDHRATILTAIHRVVH